MYTFDFLQDCTKPKLFVSGARDQFGPRAKLEALVASVPEPKKLVLIEGADHFFEGRLRELREAIEAWVKECTDSQLRRSFQLRIRGVAKTRVNSSLPHSELIADSDLYNSQHV